MAMQQQFFAPARLQLPRPKGWPARRDYRRAQRFAHVLELNECQAVFLDSTRRRLALYLWGLYFPLAALVILVGVFLLRFVAPVGMQDGMTTLFVWLLIPLLPFALIALSITVVRRTLLHREQLHLYANGVVFIDFRGKRQGARWDQLFDFRRGAHEENQRFGRVRWDIVRAAISNQRAGQSSTLKIAPRLPDGVELCARIERGYTDFWLPRLRERFMAGELLDFDALLLQRDWLGKTLPGSRRFTASLPRSFSLPTEQQADFVEGMARGLITQVDETTPVEWLRRSELKSIRVKDRHILIRTVEPVRRDSQGRADRVWFRVDTLSLKDAGILKELVTEFFPD